MDGHDLVEDKVARRRPPDPEDSRASRPTRLPFPALATVHVEDLVADFRQQTEPLEA